MIDTPMDTTNAKEGCQETPVAPTLKKRRDRNLTSLLNNHVRSILVFETCLVCDSFYQNHTAQKEQFVLT